MRGHVDAESLALYAEGQLGRRQTARVRAHLSSCPECAGTVAALTDVTTQLSHVPAPAMPSVFAARLDAALSAETAHRAATPAPAPAPQPPRRNPRWSPAALRILAGTAVALVAAGGIGYAVSQVSGSGSPSGASAPASSAAPASGHRGIKGGPFLSPGEKPNKSKPSGPTYVQSGTDYRPSTLAVQGKKVLAEYGVSGFNGPAVLPAGSVPRQVSNCATRIADGRHLLVVDLARYQHHPAYVIMLGNPDTVVAVNYSCARLDSARVRVTSG